MNCEKGNCKAIDAHKIVCDKFNLITKVHGTSIEVSLDTDLPDFTEVILSVSRTYLEKGNTAIYSVDYFSEGSTVEKWREKQSIPIADKLWKSALRSKQEEMSRYGLGFEVSSISDFVEVSVVVHVNQSNPKFGKMNINLVGKAVSTETVRVVRAERKHRYPLNAPPVGESGVPSLDPLNLDLGQAYTVTKTTALMPSNIAEDGLKQLDNVKQIPEGGGFLVLQVSDDHNGLWYRVESYDQNQVKIGNGWINSIALFGQKLKAWN